MAAQSSLSDLESIAQGLAPPPRGCLGRWAYENRDHPRWLDVIVAIEDSNFTPSAIVMWLRTELNVEDLNSTNINKHRRNLRGSPSGCSCRPISRD